MDWEHDFLSFLQSGHIAWLNHVMEALSAMGSGGVVWFVVVALLLVRRSTRSVAFEMLLSIALGFIVANLFLKLTVGRVRPYITYPDLMPLGLIPIDSSFPSGHSANAFAAAGALYLRRHDLGKLRPYAMAALVVAALIAFSRLYNCVHYPTDVLAGSIIGVLCALLAHRWYPRLEAWVIARRKAATV